MNKGSIASDGTVSVACAKCCQMSKKESSGKNVSLGDGMGKQRLGRVTTQSQEPRELPMPPVSTSRATPPSHQRRWSADLSKCGSPHVITVRKKKKEPQPPQRRTSLFKPPAVSDSLSRRSSCPHIRILSSPSSSSSCSTTSSCSSPPPIQTSAITGHDPLGWKMRPKSSFTTAQARTNRLSLQIPLPVVFPDCESRPVPNSTPDNSLDQDRSPKIKPPLGAKPSRRRHSDTSFFLRSPATPLPVVTLEALCGVRLRSVTHSDESDDVFSEGSEVESQVTPQRKIPPPVPEKTFTARKMAQLIAHSAQRCAPVSTKTTDVIYSRVMNPKSKQAHQTDLHAPKSAGLHLDTTSSRRFPGREI
ncbi:NHS-like protein 2 isoform X1 [Hippoglossus stenolepis]|uniref:NHS-like protein 2 isoform X1 n=1 Tax=Hippoglossus stenolepis TaxID=195615 RepID=UPI001FAF7460|nr:NHS-like protein 2 isoform X1 [Hippoglossus stenolepis]